MKKLFFYFFLLLSTVSYGQNSITPQGSPTTNTVNRGAYVIDSLFIIPLRDTLSNRYTFTNSYYNGRYTGALTIRPQDSLMYFYTGTKWVKVGDASNLSQYVKYSDSGSVYYSKHYLDSVLSLFYNNSIQDANNGLNKLGTEVRLGGILDTNTTIIANNNNFSILDFDTLFMNGGDIYASRIRYDSDYPPVYDNDLPAYKYVVGKADSSTAYLTARQIDSLKKTIGLNAVAAIDSGSSYNIGITNTTGGPYKGLLWYVTNTSSTQEAGTDFKASSATLRHWVGRNSSWGGDQIFVCDTVTGLQLTSNLFSVRVPQWNSSNITMNSSNPLFDIIPSTTSVYSGFRWLSGIGGSTDGSLTFKPSSASMQLAIGRSSGWGGDLSLVIDTDEKISLNGTDMKIKNVITTFDNSQTLLNLNATNLGVNSGINFYSSTVNFEGGLYYKPSSGSATFSSGRYPGWGGKLHLLVDTTKIQQLMFDSSTIYNAVNMHLGAYIDNIRTYHRVVCMGDSKTSNGIYPQYLATLLGSTWRVVNKGISGNTTTQMLARFTNDVINNETEYVIVDGGINDIAGDVSYSTITSNLQAMYTAAHNAGIKVIATTITPFKGNVSWTTGRQARLDSVNSWVISTAINTDYKVNTYSALEKPVNTDSLQTAYSADWLHMTTTGYDTLASTIYKGATWTPSSQYAKSILKIGAGTSISAPIELTAGTSLTTPSAGKIEYNGTSLFFTPSTTRLRHVLTDNTIPSNGQIPIGNGSDYNNATLTAGNNISITNGSGSITITADTSDGATKLATQGDISRAIPILSNIYSVSTTDATPTTIATIPLSTSGDVLRITVDILGKSGGDNLSGIKRATVRNVAGTLSILGSVQDQVVTLSDAALTTASFTVTTSGTNVIVQVTGVAATNINWSSIVSIKYN